MDKNIVNNVTFQAQMVLLPYLFRKLSSYLILTIKEETAFKTIQLCYTPILKPNAPLSSQHVSKSFHRNQDAD